MRRKLLVGIAIAVFIRLCAPGWAASPKFTFEHIWRVEVGMTKAQVVEILGKPDQVVKRGPGGTGDESWIWIERGRSSPKEILKNKTALVVFSGDKASGVPHRSRTIPLPVDEWGRKEESPQGEVQSKDAAAENLEIAPQSERGVEETTGSRKDDSFSSLQNPSQPGRSYARGPNLPKFALKNVAKVQPGMSKAQVEQILGKPAQIVRRAPGAGGDEAWFWSVSNLFRTKGSTLVFTGDKVSEIPPRGQMLSPEEFVKQGAQAAARLDAEKLTPGRPKQDLGQLHLELEKLQTTISEIKAASERQSAETRGLFKSNQELAQAKLQIEEARDKAEQKLARLEAEKRQVIPGQIAQPDRTSNRELLLGWTHAFVGPLSLRNAGLILVAGILLLAFLGAAVGFLVGRRKGSPGAGSGVPGRNNSAEQEAIEEQLIAQDDE